MEAVIRELLRCHVGAHIAAMSLLTRVPGGAAIVFGLAVVFSGLLFGARRRADAHRSTPVIDPLAAVA